MQQLDIFDCLYDEYKARKKIRLIEFFAGYGSQNLSLKYINANYEHYKICEWAMWSIQAYNDIHIRDYTDYAKDLSKEELVEFLSNVGVSIDWNKPATSKQLDRFSIDKLKTIYNNIIATNNLVDISRVKGEDLEIVDTDKYDYWLSYSFPCQDLSLAGLRKGMEESSETRSSLLWQVGRILNELDYESRPMVLVMENVPQIHSKENMPHFVKWIKQLEDLGYTSYWQDMNSMDYNMPQSRNRTIMVSIKGEYNFNFPRRKKLEVRLKDVLETNVPEKFYLTEKDIPRIASWKAQQRPLTSVCGRESVSPCVTARGAGEDHSGMILYSDLFEKTTNVEELLEKKQNQKLCDSLINSGILKEYDVVDHSRANSKRRTKPQDFIESKDGCCPTLTTRSDKYGVVVKDES